MSQCGIMVLMCIRRKYSDYVLIKKTGACHFLSVLSVVWRRCSKARIAQLLAALMALRKELP